MQGHYRHELAPQAGYIRNPANEDDCKSFTYDFMQFMMSPDDPDYASQTLSGMTLGGGEVESLAGAAGEVSLWVVDCSSHRKPLPLSSQLLEAAWAGYNFSYLRTVRRAVERVW